jgi:hypothetical protein
MQAVCTALDLHLVRHELQFCYTPPTHIYLMACRGLVIRELTLQCAKSFGSFHVARVFCDGMCVDLPSSCPQQSHVIRTCRVHLLPVDEGHRAGRMSVDQACTVSFCLVCCWFVHLDTVQLNLSEQLITRQWTRDCLRVSGCRTWPWCRHP